MFSLDRFYNIIHNNLVTAVPHGHSFYFYPFGTYDREMHLHSLVDSIVPRKIDPGRLICCFADQEPWYDYTIPLLEKSIETDIIPNVIFANSEKSEFKNKAIKSLKAHDWYFFFHGFLALDWYRDFEYLSPKAFTQFDKVFICYNHIISKYRSYRLHLGSNLINRDLIKFGHVSLPLADNIGDWKTILADKDTHLNTKAKIQIFQALNTRTEPLLINNDTPVGTMSASVNFDQLTSALWHVVTETVYFLPKLHLTEKTFKPVVAKRPFILVAAPGNLAYLKSYGFKTFDRWIDESYDNETDHYMRIEKITNEIEKLCALDRGQLDQMHQEMQDILEHNYQHFYGNFKKIIANELVDNFKCALDSINSTRDANLGHYLYNIPDSYLNEVKTRLSK